MKAIIKVKDFGVLEFVGQAANEKEAKETLKKLPKGNYLIADLVVN